MPLNEALIYLCFALLGLVGWIFSNVELERREARPQPSPAEARTTARRSAHARPRRDGRLRGRPPRMRAA